MLKTNKKPAFTLLELIVSMAIIAVLMGLSVFAIRAVQISQRDTERNAALQDLGIAMGQAYQNAGQYPTVSFHTNNIVFTPVSGNPITVPLKGAATAITPTQTYNSSGAIYCFTAVQSSDYVMGVKLEGTGSYKYIGNSSLSSTCADQTPN